MKKLILCLLSATFLSMIFASFPVKNISKQKEIISELKPVENFYLDYY